MPNTAAFPLRSSLPNCQLTVAKSTLAIPSHVHQWRGSVDRSSSEWFVGNSSLIRFRKSTCSPPDAADSWLTVPVLYSRLCLQGRKRGIHLGTFAQNSSYSRP
jgi:hypothetical protein